MDRLLLALFRLPFVILATFAGQQAARARRPDLSKRHAASGPPPAHRPSLTR